MDGYRPLFAGFSGTFWKTTKESAVFASPGHRTRQKEPPDMLVFSLYGKTTQRLY